MQAFAIYQVLMQSEAPRDTGLLNLDNYNSLPIAITDCGFPALNQFIACKSHLSRNWINERASNPSSDLILSFNNQLPTSSSLKWRKLQNNEVLSLNNCNLSFTTGSI